MKLTDEQRRRALSEYIHALIRILGRAPRPSDELMERIERLIDELDALQDESAAKAGSQEFDSWRTEAQPAATGAASPEVLPAPSRPNEQDQSPLPKDQP